MFGSHTFWRTAAVVGVAGLALSACTDSGPELDFEGTLAVGVIAPQSGALEFLGPAQVAAVEVALAEINAAGGVWGNEVAVQVQDEGDPEAEEAALASAQALIQAGVNAVIGPVTTDASLNVIEPLRDAGIIQISPASPGVVLDDHPARDLYLRTRPSDVLQGRVLAQELVADQRARVAIVARDDTYGQGIASLTREAYEGPGSERELAAEIRYDPETTDFAAELAELADAEPDAVVIVSFEEATEIMTALADAELIPANGVGWYLVNGNLADYSETLPEGMLEGVKATAPAVGGELTDFHARLDEHSGGLDEYAYGAEAYDALIALALGAVVANSDDPAAIREAMVSISRDPGVPCTGFAECLELIREGEEINYDGQSGPIDWTDAGDPRQGAIGIYGYGPDNTYTLVRVDVGRR